MGKNLSSNGVSFNLFRHQTAQNVLNLKELDAVWRHLFLKKEKELGLHAMWKYAHCVQIVGSQISHL